MQQLVQFPVTQAHNTAVTRSLHLAVGYTRLVLLLMILHQQALSMVSLISMEAQQYSW